MTAWYDNLVAVPFGNPNYDVQLGGSHNMTFQCAPNTVITSITNGSIITDISAPTWGKQVSMKLTQPVQGHPTFSYQHLAAINPSLKIGDVVSYNEIIGWSGGCTDASQYDGSHNPTGVNFLDDPSMSSQPQVGIALCDGTGYGYAGWAVFPPIDMSLDPQPVLDAYLKAMQPPTPDYKFEQFTKQWSSIMSTANPLSEIAKLAYASYSNGIDHGPALSLEFNNVDWKGRSHLVQVLPTGMYYWYEPENYGEWHPFKA